MSCRDAALAVAVSVGLFAGVAAQAETFCAKIDTLFAQVGDRSASVTFDFSDVQVACTHSQGLGGTAALHCAWPYEYRSPEAAKDFEQALESVAICAEAITDDAAPVSHPDSYDLRQFRLGRGTVSISLKDKATLSQTYLFVRVERPKNP